MKKILNILLLFSAVFSYGQVTINVETNKKDFTENDEVVVNVLLQIMGQNMIQETPLRMFDTSKFDIVGTGSNQNTFIDQKTGFRVNQTIYQYVLKPKKAGKFKIGSASVVVNDKLYYTEPFDIFVAPVEKKVVAESINNDVFLNVELEKNEVYKNQPTVAVLRAYSKNFNNFRKVKNIRLPEQENVNIRPVSYKKSEIEPSGNMSSQVLAVFLIYPKESGNVEVSPVSANISSEQKKIVSNKVKINVKNLPKNSPQHYKNAVGKFDVSIVNRNSDKIEVEKPLHVSVKIDGKGNFSTMDLPKLAESEDYTFYPPKIVKNTVSETSGLHGNIIANYVVIPKKSGPFVISTEHFSFFNPVSKEYVDLGAKAISLVAMSHEEMLAARTPLERVNEYTNTVLETVDNPVIQTNSLKVQHKSTINWRALIINFSLLAASFLAFLMFKNYQKKRGNNANSSNINKGKSLGSIEETEQELRAKIKVELNDYFTYLSTLKDQQDYENFFKTYEEMDHEVRNQHFQNTEADFRSFLEIHKGTQTAEEYRNLTQQIQMEKYAPIHDSEHLNELLERIKNLYSEISK